jgi:alkylation response protein AidB-like acyl-CoA dehydrogenase
VATARLLAEEVLIPHAEKTDQAALVPRSNLDALAEAGLFGMACHGAGSPAPAMRQVQEALAGACGATYFVWAQHHSPVRMLHSTENTELADRWLGPLCHGSAIAGVAFAYLRRPGLPAVSAERVAGGWRVNGTAPFVTSWGLADVFVVAAVGGPDIVWFCLPGHPTDSVRPSPPLALSVLQATSTVALRLDDHVVPDADVIKVEPLGSWRVRDRPATARPPAAALGVAEHCCRLLAELAGGGTGLAGGGTGLAGGGTGLAGGGTGLAGGGTGLAGGGVVGEAALALTKELASCRDRAYSLADALPGAQGELPVDTAASDETAPFDALEAHLALMVDARAWCLDLAQRASLALIAAVGGRAMTRSHPAQRLAREAAFYAVQAQTGAIRAATLARLTRPVGEL